MSAKQAVASLAAARDNGQNVFGETCPQYLYLSLEEQLGAPGFEGAKWVCSTPLRARAEGHQDELWKYLRTNDLSVVSTDHCPFCFKEQEELGSVTSRRFPTGSARSSTAWTSSTRASSTAGSDCPAGSSCATTPARMFGALPAQGHHRPGSDADIVVYDPAGHTSIGLEKTHHMNMDHSAWEGYEIDGHVDTVLSRGSVVIDDGEYLGRKGHGQYLRRGLSQYLI